MNMEAEKVTELIKKIFEDEIPSKFPSKMEQLAVIDAFAQFAQNPTSKSAGYGIEENYPCIKRNLSKRYEFDESKLVTIESYLRKSIEKMRKINYDIYLWRDVIKSYIERNYTEIFLKWFISLYEKLNDDEKLKFLFLIYSADKADNYSFREYLAWYNCFFNEHTTEQELKDIMVKFGLMNILYYKSSSGRVDYEIKHSFLLNELQKKFRNKNSHLRRGCRGLFQ